MGYTLYEVVDILYQRLQTILVGPTKPTGQIYPDGKRPLNSTAEDVVINSLALNEEQVQKGVLNVNVYALNLNHDNSLPNGIRLKQFAALLRPGLKEFWAPDGSYTFFLEQQNQYEEPGINQHYLNFRIRFHSLNLNSN
ncbi:hypothetical protein AHMF7605_11800 [Adhaeribacter arboris]|uniref:Uncharacterized protein n=1 Tax=Adhaeribacter arboris TaxID=2072846 RepID=A0A2T2YF65_9BACT|nr:hypothetical protein [Adhaeribacter arboris]PSR54155.1 hypothetical protein AHMF7605_11800 [Adhaeribacter arboris]